MELRLGALLHFLVLINLAFSVKQYRISEEIGPEEYIGNIVQDLNLPPLSSGEKPRQYTIFSNDDKVEIESNGDLLTKVRLDREKICPDNPPQCKIDVEIGVQQKDFKLVKIQLLLDDVNDNVPRFLSNIIEKEISESADVGSTIRLDSAVDPDLGSNSIQRYEISSSPPSGLDSNGISVPFFTLHVIENIDGTKMPELLLTESLDREKIGSYQLLLYAIDGGNPEQTGTATVVITVLDSNDNQPTFSDSSYVVDVREDVKVGQAIVQVQATDIDQGRNAKIKYSFPSIVGKQDRAIFGLNGTSGVITLKSKLDYEHKTIHHLTVEARDGASSPASAYATVTVQVQDVNDFPPKIEVKFMDAVKLPLDSSLLVDRHPNSELIKENIPVGSTLAFVTVTDKDTGENGNASCVLKDSNSFEMISVGQQQNRYLIKTKKELDREEKRLHYLEIEAWDYGFPPLTSSKTIVVELVDENDSPPTFAKARYPLSVSESVEPGQKIATLTADDDDVGPNANITYAAKSLVPGVLVPFDIVPETGVVFFKEGSLPLDAENGTKSFALNVTATDNGDPRLSSSTILEITVVDDNDNSPAFTSKNYVFRVKEDSPPGLYVGTVFATDNDVDKSSNGRISYMFETPKPVFRIDAITGEIHFYGNREDLDRETVHPQPYTFVVIATDHGEPPRSDHCTVEIYILDINDNPPRVLSPNVTRDVFFISIKPKRNEPASFLRSKRGLGSSSRSTRLGLRNRTSSSAKRRAKSALKNSVLIGSSNSKQFHSPYSVPILITRVKVRDPDDGENGRVHFTITEGNIHDYFKIDIFSGNITLNIRDEESLREMKRGCHVIKINVQDLGKPVQQTFGWANIYVTDSKPKDINATQALKYCISNSFYPRQLLPPPDDVTIAGLTLLQIIIISCAILLLLILIILFCIVRKCKCCSQKSKTYSCKTSNSYIEAKVFRGSGRSETSLHQKPIGDTSQYYADWNPSQGKAEMTHDNASEGTIRSRTSTKDSGTGDSMPNDAYYSASAGMAMQRSHLLNPNYQRQQLQPSHVNLPPQDDIITTDEEGRQVYLSYRPGTNGMVGPKCTSDCKLFGHGDHCWLPDSLPRVTSRVTPSRGAEVAEYDESSLKYTNRPKTPNSYHVVDNGRYANVHPSYYESNGQVAPTIITSMHNGGLSSGNGSSAPTSNHLLGHSGHPYYGHVGHDGYRQSPVPGYDGTSGSYPATQSTRGQPYVNLQGVHYEANGFSKDDVRSNLSNSNRANQYQNYQPKYAQQFYNQDQQYPAHQQSDSYPMYVESNERPMYYDEQYSNSYPNEFAATSLLLSPADSEAPGDMKQRFNRQSNHHPAQTTNYEYGNPSEIENQHLLNAEASGNSQSAEGDVPGAKLGTIREEMDAAEVVAGIDRLLQ